VLVMVTGGMLAVALGSVVALSDGLTWALGDRSGGALQHFEDAFGAAATILVGAFVWAHHRDVLGEATIRRRPELLRVQEYITVAAAVVATAVGASAVLAAGFDFLAGGSIVRDVVSRTDDVLPAVALLVVGAIAWSNTWSQLQDAANSSSSGKPGPVDPPPVLAGIATPPVVVETQGPTVPEKASPTRRIYLASMTIVATLVAFLALVQTGLAGVRALLDSDTSALEILGVVAMPLAVLLVATVVAIVHGRQWVRDRGSPVATRGSFPRRIVLVGPAHDQIVEELAAITGADVELHVRDDGIGLPWQTASVASSLHDLEHDQVLILAESRTVSVIPLTPA